MKSVTNRILKEKRSLSIEIEVGFVKEEDYYVAYCPALELSAYGKSIEEAKSSFEKEVAIFLEETHKRGTLEKYLLQNGWRLQQQPSPVYEPPKMDTTKNPLLAKVSESLIRQNIQIPVC